MWIFTWDGSVSNVYKGGDSLSKAYLQEDIVYPASGLPSAYQEVEYIASSWSWPYINTDFYPTNLTVSQLKVCPLMVTGDVIYGQFENGDTVDYRLFNASSIFYLDLPWWSWDYWNRIQGWSFPIWTVKEIEIWNFYVKNIGDSSNIISWSTVWAFTSQYSIRLNWTSKSYNRRYRVKIRDTWTLVRDFVPCYRKSDSVIWMYDLVNKQFYTNAWTGTFTKWPDV